MWLCGVRDVLPEGEIAVAKGFLSELDLNRNRGADLQSPVTDNASI